jgi:hypothetical protein
LPAGTRAGQDHLVDFTFTDLRQLADVAAGLRDVVSRHGLCRITSRLVETVGYRAQLREDVEDAMGSLWSSRLCSIPNSPSTEPVQLLSADERDTDTPFSALPYLDADQSERRASLLMPGKPVPKTHDEHGQQLVDALRATQLGQFAVPGR